VPPRCPYGRSSPMLDALLIAAGLGFFALSIAFIAACERM
jgi:uncharacterized protein involved in exopolysaccharide biosynthesis